MDDENVDDELVDGWINGQIKRWISVWTNGWTDRWCVNVWVSEWINRYLVILTENNSIGMESERFDSYSTRTKELTNFGSHICPLKSWSFNCGHHFHSQQHHYRNGEMGKCCHNVLSTRAETTRCNVSQHLKSIFYLTTHPEGGGLPHRQIIPSRSTHSGPEIWY